MNIIVNVCTILCLSLFLFSSFIPIIIDNNKKELFFIVLLNSPQFVCFNIYRSWSECVDVEEIEWKNKNTDYARFSLWMNDFFFIIFDCCNFNRTGHTICHFFKFFSARNFLTFFSVVFYSTLVVQHKKHCDSILSSAMYTL